MEQQTQKLATWFIVWIISWLTNEVIGKKVHWSEWINQHQWTWIKINQNSWTWMTINAQNLDTNYTACTSLTIYEQHIHSSTWVNIRQRYSKAIGICKHLSTIIKIKSKWNRSTSFKIVQNQTQIIENT